jgi:hypothetical protein
VTNEHDRSILIKDLYAKIELSLNGTIPYEYDGFRLLRSTFPYIQFKEGYIHSHVPRLHHHNESSVKEWESPCLGSGPIRKTILDLHNNNEDALWMLFCQELSLYVTVESLSGGPYFRMEEIGTGTYLTDYNNYLPICFNIKDVANCWYYINPDVLEGVIREFTRYYLENGNLTFNYKAMSFVPGMPFFDFIVDISNCFIKWYNNQPVKKISKENLFRNVLIEATTSNRKFYKKTNSSNNTDFSNLEGTPLLTFKNKEITLHIEPDIGESSTINNVTLLNYRVAACIISNILKTINYRYENEYTKEHGRIQETSSSYRKVCYL